MKKEKKERGRKSKHNLFTQEEESELALWMLNATNDSLSLSLSDSFFDPKERDRRREREKERSVAEAMNKL